MVAPADAAGSHLTRPVLRLEFLLVAAAGATAWLAGPKLLGEFGPRTEVALPAAGLASAVLAGVAWRLRTVTLSGAAAGAAVATILAAALGWPAWLLLGLALILTAVSTAFGWRQKAQQGIAEAHQGRRRAGNVFANTGAAALVAIAARADPGNTALGAGFAAALATGACDTVASEAGKAVGGRTWLLPSFRVVAPGTLGAASMAGTIAGALSAVVCGLAALAAGVVHSWSGAAIVSWAATTALVLEGPVAVLTEPRGVLDNDGVNFVSSLIGAALAVAAANAVR